MEKAITHLKLAEAELVAAIRCLGVDTAYDRMLSFVAFLVIYLRVHLEGKEQR